MCFLLIIWVNVDTIIVLFVQSFQDEMGKDDFPFYFVMFLKDSFLSSLFNTWRHFLVSCSASPSSPVLSWSRVEKITTSSGQTGYKYYLSYMFS